MINGRKRHGRFDAYFSLNETPTLHEAGKAGKIPSSKIAALVGLAPLNCPKLLSAVDKRYTCL